jgi:hypothetical protein
MTNRSNAVAEQPLVLEMISVAHIVAAISHKRRRNTSSITAT